MNLLKETIKIIENNSRDVKEVQWVGNTHYAYMIWKDFEKIANFEYDDSYGAQLIAYDLVIVTNDWWLERCEHAGSEWWVFKELPRKPKIYKNDFKLHVIDDDDYCDNDLSSINE